VTGRTLCVGAAAAAIVASVAAADAARETFGVGVLRRDGIIVPFAAFDGKRWSNPWPLPDREVLVPINVASVPSKWWGPTPPLDTWQVITSSGATVVRVGQLDWVDVQCTRQVGLRTDYRAQRPAPPRTAQPYPKDGLAIAPPRPVDRIDVVSPVGDEARALLPTILTSFNDAERRTEGRFGHPIARRAREGIAPTIEAIYAYGGESRVFYVEATRTYRRLGETLEDCAGIGFGTGWFVRDAAGIRTLTMVVDILNCDRNTASYMLPLGVLQLNGKIYWLAQFSGFDHERYAVVEVKPKSVEVAVNTWGGAC
jgi:hypothetical protein